MILIILPDYAVEDELLAKARLGDKAAIRRIFNDYFDPIFQFIRMRVDDKQTAEDLASDVFVKMLKAFQSGSAPRQSLRGWLFQVARNEIADYFGKHKRLTMTVLDEWIPASDEDEPELQFARSLNIQQARQALKKLTEEQQEVLILRFGQMLNLQETADIMGKQVNAVKVLQFRAVNALRRALGTMRLETSS